MTIYRKKDPVSLAWSANVQEVRHRAKLLFDIVINEALGKLSDQFEAALERGELLELVPDENDLRELFLASAKKKLG